MHLQVYTSISKKMKGLWYVVACLAPLFPQKTWQSLSLRHNHICSIIFCVFVFDWYIVNAVWKALPFALQYWVSQGNKWCDTCKIYISNNPASIRNHEIGQRHKDSVAKRLNTMREDKAKKDKELKQAAKVLEQIEAVSYQLIILFCIVIYSRKGPPYFSKKGETLE